MHIGSQAFFAGRTGKGPLIHKFKEIPEFNFFDSKNFDINLRNGDVYQIGSTKLGGSQKFCSYAFWVPGRSLPSAEKGSIWSQ